MALSNSFDSVYVNPYFEIDRIGRVYVEADVVSVSTARNIITLESAGSNQPTIQDLGKKPTGLILDVTLVDMSTVSARFGDTLTAYEKAQVLEQSMNEDRETTFHHPTQGEYRVRLVSIQQQVSNRSLGIINARISLLVTDERETVPVVVRSAPRGLQDRSYEMLDVAEERGIMEYRPPANAEEQAALSNDVLGLTTDLTNSGINVAGPGVQSFERLSNVFAEPDRLNDSVISLLNEPARFVSDARLVIDNLQDIENPREFAQSLFRIVTGLEGSPTPFGRLSRLLGLGRLVRLIGSNPIRQLFTSRPTAEDFLDSINFIVAEEIAGAPIETVEVLQNVQTTLAEYAAQELPALPGIRNVSYKEPQPSLTLSADLYGNLDEADDISQSVLHPFLVRDVEVRIP